MHLDISKRRCGVASAALFLLANALAANSALPTTIERVANARSILASTGTADGAGFANSKERLIALNASHNGEPLSKVVTASPSPFVSRTEASNGVFGASPGMISGGTAVIADGMAITPAGDTAWAPAVASGTGQWRQRAIPVIAGLWQIDTPSAQIVFEAAAIALFGLGLAALGLDRRCRFSQR